MTHTHTHTPTHATGGSQDGEMEGGEREEEDGGRSCRGRGGEGGCTGGELLLKTQGAHQK